MLIQLETTTRRPMRVGALARRTGKTVRALHLYEERGLLVPTERSKGGYRLFGYDAVLRVRWISKLQDMGFSLTQIQEVLQSWEQSHSAPSAMRRLEGIYREKLEETRAQLGKLAALESELQASLAYLETCDTCDPERLVGACSACDQHAPKESPPDLVAGVQRPAC
jgi:MerR family copper efflux transcriptional regulator